MASAPIPLYGNKNSTIFYLIPKHFIFKRGMAEMHKLGQNLAKRYIIERPLLSRSYKPKEVRLKRVST